MQTCVAITSLIENKDEETIYDIYILSSECNKQSVEKLQRVNYRNCSLKIIPVSTEKYQDIKQLEHIPIACLLKFDICDIIQKYDKVIYLDGDIIVKKDLKEFFSIDLKDNFLGGVLEGSCIGENFRRINAGILLMNLKRMRDERMSEILIQTRRGLGDRGSMDQQTMNLVFRDKITFLPLKYNCIAANFIGRQKLRNSLDEINSLYGSDYKEIDEIISDAVIVHYATGFKPWLYTYAPCGELWHTYYKKTPYSKEQLKRMGKLQNWIHMYIDSTKKYGIAKGTYRVIRHYIAKFSKHRNSDWG